MAFVPDALAVPRSLGGSFEPAVRFGSGTTRLDPMTVITLMSSVTTRLGVAATMSTGYQEPYNLARSMGGTLDHLSGGRAGWNVVTSFQDAEAQNFGQDKLPDREERYARAEEFLEVTTRLWDSWSDDALIRDKVSVGSVIPTRWRPSTTGAGSSRCRGRSVFPPVRRRDIRSSCRRVRRRRDATSLLVGPMWSSAATSRSRAPSTSVRT